MASLNLPSSSFVTRVTPTAVQDGSQVGLSQLKDHLRIGLSDTSHDKQLKMILAGVKEAADEYCQNAFTNGIPNKVEVWIKMQCANLFEWGTNGVAASSEPGFGSASIKDRCDTTLLRTLRVWPGF